MGKIFLKKNADRRLKSGHLWIFSNEIAQTDNHIENGEVVEVFDFKGIFLALGFFNENSLISVRIISYSRNLDLPKIFEEKINFAYKLRKELYPHRNSYRMVFSESDFLPGLIIDKYNDSFVLQVNSFGMSRNIHHVVNILRTNFNAKNIFTKNDFYLRKLEGLAEEDSVYLGERCLEIIDDGSIKYKIDFVQSQKTGFYFDQSDNRFFIEKIVKGKKTADVFSNCGGFGMHALKAGALSVDFVDSSAREIENVKVNLKLNGLKGKFDFYVCDAFDFLMDAAKVGNQYDVVMLDPPAFAKSKKNLRVAEKGYEKINKLALQLIKNEGYLVTSSCSYHLSKDLFLDCINRAAAKSSKKIQMVHINGASLDHPMLPSMEETSYLKFAVFKVFSA